ncbi:MAG: HEAT repeat domain-containing protein [Planctomycetota bacterium]|jgi:hypothetical protein
MIVLAAAVLSAGLFLAWPRGSAEREEIPVRPSTPRVEQTASGEVPAPETPATPPGDQDAAPAPDTAWFQDPGRPLAERRERIGELARRGDPDSVRVLMEIGDAKTYVNRYAVEALGQVADPMLRDEIVPYLKKKLGDGDALVLCAAVRALGALAREDAVSPIVAAMGANRERHDGHEEMVCTAAVRTLGEIGSSGAVPALAGDLARVPEGVWGLEYGSEVVAALGKIDDPEGLAAVASYADRLEANLPEDSMPRKYYETKIDEARRIAARE